MRTRALWALCLVLAARGAMAAPLAVLTNPTPTNDDLFGWAVTALGPNIVVAEPADDVGRPQSGSVHLFTPMGTLIRTIPNPIPQPDPIGTVGPRFGWSVAALGGDLLVGASVFQEDTGPCAAAPANCLCAGTAFLMDPNVDPGGAVLHRFVNPAPARFDQFGMAVAAVGGDVLIGAPFANAGGLADSGAAYLFHFNGADWVLRKTFTSPRPRVGERFGMAVAALGDDVLIGAPFVSFSGFCVTEAPSSANGPGSVYRFSFNGSDWDATAYDSPSATTDAFGQSLATPGGRILVGAPKGGAQDRGAAYLIDPADTDTSHATAFHSPQKCTSAPGDRCQQFGIGVAALGPDVLVGAWNDEVAGPRTGAAYLFRQNGTLARTFLAETPIAGDEFGVSVAAVGGLVVVGADKARAADGTRGGAAFVFEPPICGDGTTDPDEECDAGGPTACCTADCRVVANSNNRPCGDPTLGPCDDPDLCDTRGRCLKNYKPENFACPDDGNECTQDFCDGAGACGHPPQPTAFPCTVPEPKVCEAYSCDGLGTCVADLTAKDDEPCDNGDLICLGDTCQGGVCRNYAPCQERIDGTKAEPAANNPSDVQLTCTAGVPGVGNFCAVESATVDTTPAALVASVKPNLSGRLVIRKKQIRNRLGQPKPFPLDPVTGTRTVTLKLNALGRKLLKAAGKQGMDLPVKLSVVVVANQQTTRLQLLARLRRH
jgi:FG-GAP repeat protein